MSNGVFLLLLAATGIGVRQLTLLLPIAPEVVQRYRDQQRARQFEPQKTESDVDEYWSINHAPIFNSEDDTWSSFDVNIDGTPMVGDIDIHGNPFGVTDHHW